MREIDKEYAFEDGYNAAANESKGGDLISREALRNVILKDRKLDGANANWEVNRILVHIDKAPTVTPQAFINGIVELISKNGITTIDELLETLKGGAE